MQSKKFRSALLLLSAAFFYLRATCAGADPNRPQPSALKCPIDYQRRLELDNSVIGSIANGTYKIVNDVERNKLLAYGLDSELLTQLIELAVDSSEAAVQKNGTNGLSQPMDNLCNLEQSRRTKALLGLIASKQQHHSHQVGGDRVSAASSKQGSISGCNANRALGLYITEKCMQTWLKQVAQIRQEFSHKLNEQLSLLLDTVMQTTSRRWPKTPQKPYRSADLHRLQRQLNPSGVILYMQHSSAEVARLLHLDENMQNSALSASSFKSAFSKSILPLCQPLCSRLKSHAKVYESSSLWRCLDYSNQQQAAASNLVDIDLLDTEQTLVEAVVCCRLIRSFEQPSGLRAFSRKFIDKNDYYNVILNLIKVPPESEALDEVRLVDDLVKSMSEAEAEFLRKHHEQFISEYVETGNNNINSAVRSFFSRFFPQKQTN